MIFAEKNTFFFRSELLFCYTAPKVTGGSSGYIKSPLRTELEPHRSGNKCGSYLNVRCGRVSRREEEET